MLYTIVTYGLHCSYFKKAYLRIVHVIQGWIIERIVTIFVGTL